MTRRRQHHTKIVGAFVRIPEPLEPGKVRCAACSKVVTLTKNGRLRKHKTPDGKEDCPYSVVYGKRVTVPKVQIVIPTRKGAPTSRQAARYKPELPPSRLDVGSTCEECGKWIPGERRLCGACFATRPVGGKKAAA